MRRILLLPAPDVVTQALAYLAYRHPDYITPDVVGKVRALLTHYPPKVVLGAITQAWSEFLKTGQLPSRDEKEAYFSLLDTIDELGRIISQVHPLPLAA